MPDDYLEGIRARMAENQNFLKALKSGHLHIGAPFEGRTEARIYDLERKIADDKAIIEKNDASRT